MYIQNLILNSEPTGINKKIENEYLHLYIYQII